mgnify:CR=1 FL=1
MVGGRVLHFGMTRIYREIQSYFGPKWALVGEGWVLRAIRRCWVISSWNVSCGSFLWIKKCVTPPPRIILQNTPKATTPYPFEDLLQNSSLGFVLFCCYQPSSGLLFVSSVFQFYSPRLILRMSSWLCRRARRCSAGAAWSAIVSPLSLRDGVSGGGG